MVRTHAMAQNFWTHMVAARCGIQADLLQILISSFCHSRRVHGGQSGKSKFVSLRGRYKGLLAKSLLSKSTPFDLAWKNLEAYSVGTPEGLYRCVHFPLKQRELVRMDARERVTGDCRKTFVPTTDILMVTPTVLATVHPRDSQVCPEGTDVMHIFGITIRASRIVQQQYP